MRQMPNVEAYLAAHAGRASLVVFPADHNTDAGIARLWHLEVRRGSYVVECVVRSDLDAACLALDGCFSPTGVGG